MQTEEGVVRKISDIVKSLDGLPPDVTRDITEDTSIINDLRLDSIAIMDFVMAVETEFDIIIPIDEIAGIQTVGDLAGVIGAKCAKTAH